MDVATLGLLCLTVWTLAFGRIANQDDFSSWFADFTNDAERGDQFPATVSAYIEWSAASRSAKVYTAAHGTCYDAHGHASVPSASSLFRVGSITKVLTATALMQLIERHDVGFGDPITQHMPFLHDIWTGDDRAKLDRITVLDLFTHRCGFDTAVLNLFPKFPTSQQSKGLRSQVEKGATPIVRAPGSWPMAYSNLCATLEGLLIESVTGVDYRDYIRDNIFVKLGMSRSYFTKSLSEAPNGLDNLCVPEKSYEPLDIGLYPAGDLITSIDDLSKFFVEHLSGGGNLFKNSSTLTDTMHSMQTSLGPIDFGRVNGTMVGGMALQWFLDVAQYTHRYLYHGGTSFTSTSIGCLLPDTSEAFLSFTTHRDAPALSDPDRAAFNSFIQRQYPQATNPNAVRFPVSTGSLSASLDGQYMHWDATQRGLGKLLTLVQGPSFTISTRTASAIDVTIPNPDPRSSYSSTLPATITRRYTLVQVPQSAVHDTSGQLLTFQALPEDNPDLAKSGVDMEMLIFWDPNDGQGMRVSAFPNEGHSGVKASPGTRLANLIFLAFHFLTGLLLMAYSAVLPCTRCCRRNRVVVKGVDDATNLVRGARIVSSVVLVVSVALAYGQIILLVVMAGTYPQLLLGYPSQQLTALVAFAYLRMILDCASLLVVIVGMITRGECLPKPIRNRCSTIFLCITYLLSVMSIYALTTLNVLSFHIY